MDNIKILLGITDDNKDALLGLLLSMVQNEVLAYCNIDAIPAALDNAIYQMVVQKYNRLGQEGIISTKFNGISESFTDS